MCYSCQNHLLHRVVSYCDVCGKKEICCGGSAGGWCKKCCPNHSEKSAKYRTRKVSVNLRPLARESSDVML